MPVQYRKYLIRKTQEIKDKEAEQMKNNKNNANPGGPSNIPDSLKKGNASDPSKGMSDIPTKKKPSSPDVNIPNKGKKPSKPPPPKK